VRSTISLACLAGTLVLPVGGSAVSQYADILAYFFSLRGLPAGDAELVSDVELLKEIQIDRP
jgi:hypothetical protein